MSTQHSSLQNWRKQIDGIDTEIIRLIGRRMDKVQSIGAYKKINNLTPLNEKRKEAVLKKWLREGAKHELSEKFITTLFCVVHSYSIDVESDEK